MRRSENRMSSNGTRKETRGWEVNPTTQSGKMINIDTDDVPIEAIESVSAAVTVVAPMPTPGMAPPPVPGAPTTEVRARRSTLETFNEEMAVLERPLENDVEYIDEAPQPSRWRGVALFAGIVLGMGMGGGVILSRRQPAVQPIAKAPQPVAPAPVAAAPAPDPAPAAAPAAAAAEAPVLAAQVPAAAAAPEAAAAAAEDDEAATDGDAPAAAPPSHGAWTKVKSSSHGKHAAGKSAHHRSAKRAVAKRAGSRR